MNREKNSFAFVILAIFLGNFIAQLNSGTVNVALPSIMHDLHSDINSVQWIITGFLLAIGTIAPVSGYLGNKAGNKRLYVSALVGLTIFSALCCISWNIGSLIAFRILQGMCSGLIQVSTMTIIYQSVQKEKQAMAVSLWTISIMVAPAIGPTIGGLITSYWGWKTLFLSNVPIGIIAVLCAVIFLPGRRESKAIQLDKTGLITVVIGNVSLLMYFTKGASLGWLSLPALGILFLGIGGIAGFIWRELSAKEPLLNIRVLKYPKYALGTICSCLISIGLYSSVFLIPLFMEEAQGQTSFTVGLVMLPGALMMIVVTMITGRLQAKIDPAWFALLGAVLLSAATWEFSHLTKVSSAAFVTVWMIVRYIGVGLAMSPVTGIAMSVIPKEYVGHASAISNWLRQAVSALSIAIFSSILAVRTEAHLSKLSSSKIGEDLKQSAFLFASNDTFLVATIVLIMTIPLALILKKRKAKPLMETMNQGS
ncbi:MDR family MFS transporter [Metabacillus sp. RGM 3146]|uniref:MDR family MFS transporter n=1 Tax=Metabacillus sp. RGM 3146 TaxID=3401092 RepID=UPI003B9C9FCB